jgi:hypothetical protein
MTVNSDYYDDLVKAEYIGEFKIKCTFKDGKQGIVDMSHYSKKGGVFSKLADLEYFKTFYIDNGVLSWGEGEIDIAPETLYHKATGEPYPPWMEIEDNLKVPEPVISPGKHKHHPSAS